MLEIMRGVIAKYPIFLNFWATHSRLDPVIDCAKTIKQHWNGIANYIKTEIDNDILEGTNNLIQAARIVQVASGQQRILLLLFIIVQENFNSTYPHETAKSPP
jgi:hypothetical protein